MQLYLEAGDKPPLQNSYQFWEEGQYKDLLSDAANKTLASLTRPGDAMHTYRGIRRPPMNQIDAVEADWKMDRRLAHEDLLRQRDSYRRSKHQLSKDEQRDLQRLESELGELQQDMGWHGTTRNENFPPTMLEQGLLDEFDGLRFEDPVDEFRRGATPRRLKNPRQPPTGPGPGALSGLMDSPMEESRYGQVV